MQTAEAPRAEVRRAAAPREVAAQKVAMAAMLAEQKVV